MNKTTNQFSLPGGASHKRFPGAGATCFAGVLVLMVLPSVAQAQFDFTTNNDAITITGYTGPGGAVTIPSSSTSIQEQAFLACGNLANVYFLGNAPSADSSVFAIATNATVYYLTGTTGWSNSFCRIPAVLWNPQAQTTDGRFGVQGNQFGFTITGTTNIPLVVEACTSLANPVWVPLQSCTLTNGSIYFSDPEWTNYPGRFYRIRSPRAGGRQRARRSRYARQPEARQAPGCQTRRRALRMGDCVRFALAESRRLLNRSSGTWSAGDAVANERDCS